MRASIAMCGSRLDPAFVLDPDAEATSQQVRSLFQNCTQFEEVGRALLTDPSGAIA
ncbi:hypothetical protein [Microvirga tunisiensis]|uniref:hypothetical protein n=1 Tax=Microvirga tunisiensis TaxID=2108360 RepID=UPI00129CC273|nr:hypothetical protein [Microvirga tunisiensis]